MFQKYFFSILIFLLISFELSAQITVENYAESISVRYNDGNSDDLYIVCGEKDDNNITILATASSGTSSTFTWEKYDTLSASFQWYADGAINDTLTSTLTNIEEGCYRVMISDSHTLEVAQAWVIQNWILPEAIIPDSSSVCDYFKIVGSFTASTLSYFDLSDNSKVNLRTDFSDFTYYWKYDGSAVSSDLSPTIQDPIASETPLAYTLEIEDEYGCTGTTTVDYISKVPKAAFDYDPESGEAVLEVTFTNNSINYDESFWNFSKKFKDIALELAESKTGEVDSINFILEEEAPVYEFEEVGTYSVYLVTAKNNSTGTCYDTTWMQSPYIVTDESLIDAPNFFTPNGDGENDQFIIRSKSLKRCTIKIYNRWGGLVHSWKYTNIRSNDYTYEHSVWDGKVGRRYASPGVYYYFISAEGRDGKKHKLKGFVHLFRQKNAGD